MKWLWKALFSVVCAVVLVSVASASDTAALRKAEKIIGSQYYWFTRSGSSWATFYDDASTRKSYEEHITITAKRLGIALSPLPGKVKTRQEARKAYAKYLGVASEKCQSYGRKYIDDCLMLGVDSGIAADQALTYALADSKVVVAQTDKDRIIDSLLTCALILIDFKAPNTLIAELNKTIEKTKLAKVPADFVDVTASILLFCNSLTKFMVDSGGTS